MSALALSAKLDRSDANTSWGFRMFGGKDFGAPLTIQRVTPGSLAQKCGLQEGDVIMKIADAPTDYMRHKEAQHMIVNAGNNLELALQRGSHGGGSRGPPAGGYHTVQAPGYSPSPAAPAAPSNADYNRAPQPFSPGSSVPVAVNKQYNTPINMYSMDNVMDSLITQTSALNVGPGPGKPGGSDPIPPWQSAGGGPSVGGGGGGGAPASNVLSPKAQPPRAAQAPGTWQPKIPTGPRVMKFGASGTAKSMPAIGGGGRIPMCNSCGTAIRGPFVAALDKTWCPQCFICSNPQCAVPLLGIGFVEEDGQLFCERDYEQFFAPRCGKCGCAIVRECVNALKDTFCPGCFTCVTCNQVVGQGAFHLEDGQIYCEKDWQAMFQTKCYGCQFPIEPGDRWVEALSQNWHSECFNCSTCQVNLEGQSFFAKGGKPYCKKHASTKRF